MMQTNLEMTETLAYEYSSESTQYLNQHDKD